MADRKKIILSPEIYLAATTSGGGPPAELFNMAISLRSKFDFVLSPWVKQQIIEGMLSVGYDKAKAEDQGNFITSLFKMVEVESSSDNPLVDLAKQVGTTEIYCASNKSGTEVDGIKYRPISELIEILRGAT